MKASITFLLFWLGFIVLGSFGSFIIRSDIDFSAFFDIWLHHDIVYILIFSWILAAIVIVYLYTIATAGKKEDKQS